MRIFPVFLAQAGCPQACVFCSRWQVAGGIETPQPEAVASQLAAQPPLHGDGEIAFYGGSFTALDETLQRAYLDAVAPLLAAGRAAGIRVSTRPDAIDPSTARRLTEAGVRTVELGCQTFSDRVLAASGRGHDATAPAPAVAALRGAGLRVGLQLMPGLPGSDAAEARSSLTTALALRPDFLRIYPTLVLAGSRLEKDWRAVRYRPLELDAAVEICADLLILCRRAGVPVIRLGLQGDAELERGLLAGPYHPAFGQLVRSRLWRRALQRLVEHEEARTVSVSPAELSDAVGHRRANLDYFAARYTPLKIQAAPQQSAGTLGLEKESFSLLELAGLYLKD